MSNDPSHTNRFLQHLLNSSVDGIVAFDRSCRYTVWNRAMEHITGIASEHVVGKNAFEVFPFLRDTGEDKCFFAALGGENTVSENRPYTVPETGRAGFFRGHYSPLRDQDNQIVGGIAIIRDITERKRAEDAARDAYQRMIFHVENSPLAVIEWDTDFRVSRWSESAESLFGWTAAEVIGKHVGDWHFVFDDDIDAVEQVTNRQRVGEELQGVQHNRNYTKGGDILYCEWYNSVLRDDDGDLVSVLSLVLDVTARKLAEEERVALLARERDARRQAQESDRLKDEFLATLSHELRTPLTSILGWAILIRKGEVEQANFERALETIERNARAQARLIDDLLDVSRIITGNLRLDIRPINLASVVMAAKDGLRPTAEAKCIDVKTEFEYGSYLVKGDSNRLRQVIWNLVLNAIKFTPRDGSVTVRLERIVQGSAQVSADPQPFSHVRLTVADTGDGIPAEFLPYAFDRFRQAEGSLTRKQGGLGLGLAVVRHLVELHGGNVSAESPGRGLGSTFTVDLPLAENRRDPARAEERKREVERRRSVITKDRSRGSEIVGVKVLLVEDDDDTRQLLTLTLERQGAEVIPVASSSEAFEMFGEAGDSEAQRNDDNESESAIRIQQFALDGLPEVIISDIGMAEQDGYQLIRKVRALPAEHGGLIPAIALTGYATRKDRDRALAAGYQLHIAKPVEPDTLVSAILSLTARRS